MKSLHILAVCLFFGNVVVSAFWKVYADRTRNLAVVTFATRLVNLTDMVFTATGATLLSVTGHLMAGQFGGIASQAWIYQAYTLFGLSGGLWLFGLLPIQIRQARILATATDGVIPAAYWPLVRRWNWIGVPATLLPLPAIWLMVHHGW